MGSKVSKKTKYLLYVIVELTVISMVYFPFLKYNSYVNNIINFFTYRYSLVTFLIAQIFAVLIIFYIHLIPTLDNNIEDHGTSNWESDEDFEKNVYEWNFVDKPGEGGIFVGASIDKKTKKIKGAYHLIGAMHSLIIAASRSGKTRKIIIETIKYIIASNESMVINDPKGELYLIFNAFLKKIGYKIICLDFRSPLKSNFWNPLQLIKDFFKKGNESLAIEASWDLANILVPSTDASDDNIFEKVAQSLLAGAMIYLCLESKDDETINMTSLNGLLIDISDERSDVGFDNIVRSLSKDHPARKAWGTAFATKGQLRASIFGNALASLRLYTDPAIETMTHKQDHSMAMVGKEKTAIFTIIPDEKSTRHSLATGYHSQLYQVLIQTAIEYGGRLPVPVHYIYDEFGNCPVVPDMGSKVTAAASRGIKFYLVLQDLQQLKKYGDHTANTILANMHNWLYISTNNPETSKVICEKLGKSTIKTRDLSYNDPFDLVPRESIKLIERELKTQDELLRWKNDHIILMPQGRKPSFHKILDASEYYYYKEDLELEGNQEIDGMLLHHRENLRKINKRVNVAVFDINKHLDNFKKEIIKKIDENNSIEEIAREYGINPKEVKRYVKEFKRGKKDTEVEFNEENFYKIIELLADLESENNILRESHKVFSSGRRSIKDVLENEE